MRSFINFCILRFFTYIGKSHLASRYCFNLLKKNHKIHWIDGNRQFFFSGKYINGKKHGDFRKYNALGEPIMVEKYNSGQLYSRLHIRMKNKYI